MANTIEPQMLVFFGVTGDLTRRKLIPGLYRMCRRGVLGSNIPIVCVARRDLTKEAFIELLDFDKYLPDVPKDKLDTFLQQIHYVKADFDSDDHTALHNFLVEIDKQYQCGGNQSFYLATPPSIFERISQIISKHCILDGWHRIAFEKPFGYDSRSASELHEFLSDLFDEDQIYRIDHYLGKELIQNILTFRFSNAIFEQIWNRNFIDHVQVTISESVGVEDRGGYYDNSGAIRDMLQNHLLETVALTAMEPPDDISADAIRNEKVKVLQALHLPEENDVVVGQYGPGNGMKGYREEEGVPHDSQTETFVALRMFIDTERWVGVPFYIRTGKRLSKRYSEIHLVLKDVSCKLFSKDGVCEPRPNVISIRIQPDEGIAITFNSKVPGVDMELESVEMDFCHKCLFGLMTPAAYEVLLEGLMTGNQTHFTRWDEVEASWQFTDSVRDIVAAKQKDFPNYEAGGSGPQQAMDMFAEFGKTWVEHK